MQTLGTKRTSAYCPTCQKTFRRVRCACICPLGRDPPGPWASPLCRGSQNTSNRAVDLEENAVANGKLATCWPGALYLERVMRIEPTTFSLGSEPHTSG